MRKAKSDYDVGYGKPPAATQFKKGRSGNPAGRPKGRLNFETIVEQALSEEVVVTEGGRRVKKSKLVVMTTQAVNKAAAGDLKAFKLVLGLAAQFAPAAEAATAIPDLIADRKVALRIAARILEQAEKDSGGDSHE